VAPLVSVVMCTYNRAGVVEHTLQAVLDQTGPPFEVVVIDDGSTDATPKVLAAIDDPRLRVVRQENAGMSSARNAGVAVAEGEWLIFLDDDDVPEPGWLRALTDPMDDPEVGITCCGARGVRPDGSEICPLPAIPLGPPFGDVVGAYRAGTFAVRSELYRRAGGHLDGLGTSEQFELFIRLLAEAQRDGQRVESADEIVLNIERRPVDDRRSSNPHVAYDATTWVVSRHSHTNGPQPLFEARFEGVAGTTAARVGLWRDARRHFWRSARLDPRMRVRWARLALSFMPPLARRVWDRHGSGHYDAAQAGVPMQLEPEASGPDGLPSELFLHWRYEENDPPADSDAAPVAAGVQRLADRIAKRHPSIHCLGALERHPDPVGLLRQLARDAADSTRGVLVSTPDRLRTDPDRPMGPPSNPRHRREWSQAQLRLLLRSTGLDVSKTWRRGNDMVVLAHPSQVLGT